MKLYYFLLFIVLKSGVIFCQTEIIDFQIINDKTNQPIKFCYAIIKDSPLSSQSDEFGNVSIKINFTDTLIIYQLGYVLKKTTLTEIIKNNKIVLLQEKNFILDEVVINVTKTQTLQEKSNTTYIDFDFYDDFILALTNKGKKHNSIMLLDITGEKMYEKNPAIVSEKLFKDCFGNVHLVAKDSIYQIYYDYSKLSLLGAFPISDYNHVLKPCECTNGYNYIFKINQYRNLKNVYYIFNDQKQKKTIDIIADSAAIKAFNIDFDINYFLSKRRKGEGYNTSVSELDKNIDLLREELVLPLDYNNLLRPVESEMKKIDSVFILADYTHKQLSVFSEEGNKIKTTNLNITIDILPKMYYDIDRREVIFSSRNKHGVLTLYKYNINENKCTHQFTLKEFYFVKEPKIKNGNLFFIYKNRSSDMYISKIIKEPIIWSPFKL